MGQRFGCSEDVTVEGLKVSCRACGTEFKKDPETGNYECPKPGCGKGGIRGKGGISVTKDEKGNVSIVSAENAD